MALALLTRDQPHLRGRQARGKRSGNRTRSCKCEPYHPIDIGDLTEPLTLNQKPCYTPLIHPPITRDRHHQAKV